jgi:hypothetical protein
MKFYIDLDGVLVDLQAGYKKETGYELNHVWDLWNKDKKRIWGSVNSAGFWLTLPKTPACDLILKTLEKVKDSVYILSSPIKKNRQSCKEQKIQWVLNNTWIPKERVYIVDRENKKNFATIDSILLDDYEDNIVQWRQAGGIGIHHDENNINTTQLLLQANIIQEEIRNAKRY